MSNPRFRFKVDIEGNAGQLYITDAPWLHPSYNGDLKAFLNDVRVGLMISEYEYRIAGSNFPHIKTMHSTEQGEITRAPGNYDGVILVAYLGLELLTVTFHPKTGHILVVPPKDHQVKCIEFSLYTSLAVPTTTPTEVKA